MKYIFKTLIPYLITNTLIIQAWLTVMGFLFSILEIPLPNSFKSIKLLSIFAKVTKEPSIMISAHILTLGFIIHWSKWNKHIFYIHFEAFTFSKSFDLLRRKD